MNKLIVYCYVSDPSGVGIGRLLGHLRGRRGGVERNHDLFVQILVTDVSSALRGAPRPSLRRTAAVIGSVKGPVS